MRYIPILALLWITILFPTSILAQDKLIYAIDVIRHGDRTPIKDLPTVSVIWKEGLGQLTAEGMRQEYELGKLLRKQYIDEWNLLPSRYEVKTLSVYSTPFDRTLMSAQSFLLGFYPAGTGPLLSASHEPALPYAFQPIPIYTLPSQEQIPHLGTNALQTLAAKYVYNQADWQAKNKMLQAKYPRWSVLSGVKITELSQLRHVGGTLYVYQLHQVILPKGFNNQDVDEMIEAGKWALVRMFRPQVIGKTIGAPFLKTITQNLAKATHDSQLKYQIYFAHDSTQLLLLSALGAPLDEPPPYSATLNFSLYEAPDKSRYVKINFNHKPIYIPYCKGYVCTVSQLIDFTKR